MKNENDRNYLLHGILFLLICVWLINAQIGGGPVQPIPKVTERWIYTYDKK